MGKKRRYARAYGVLATFCAAVLGLVGFTAATFPDHYYTTEAGTFSLSCGLLSSFATPSEHTSARKVAANATRESVSTLRLWGIFPVKQVTVRETETPTVRLGGTPFGVKLYTDGVLVVGINPVDATGQKNPAKDAGLHIGDTVLSVDGVAVATNEEIAAIVSHCGGHSLTLRVRRDDIEFTAQLVPVFSETEGVYKAGIWVRDSSAGIGTVTFYEEQTHGFAGLGHAICDPDTAAPLPIGSGELVPATIFGISRGQVGQAGELRGSFESGTLGTLYANCDTGVFGTVTAVPSDAERIPLAMKQQVVTGAAKTRTTLEGKTPAWYDIEIVQIRYHDGSPTRNMVVKITDPLLLERAGGIVQGMSGSPIVQNGKLVGAITHVFVNDPTQGFAIFAENMYTTLAACNAEQDAA